MKHATLFLLLLSILILTPSLLYGQAPAGSVQNATATESSADQPAVQERYPRYKVDVGDSLEIAFRFTPEYNQTVLVQPDGFISLREAGDIHVQGLTTDQLRATVATSYQHILRDPDVAITLKDFKRPFVVVGGWVRSPGKYELRGDTSLTVAIQYAGGFTDESKHSKVWLYRRGPDGALMEGREINVKQMLASGNLNEDLNLRPGDMIYVPQNNFSKVKGLLLPKAAVAATFPVIQ